MAGFRQLQTLETEQIKLLKLVTCNLNYWLTTFQKRAITVFTRL